MAAKAIYEADAKSLIYRFCKTKHLARNNLLSVNEKSNLLTEESTNDWLANQVWFCTCLLFPWKTKNLLTKTKLYHLQSMFCKYFQNFTRLSDRSNLDLLSVLQIKLSCRYKKLRVVTKNFVSLQKTSSFYFYHYQLHFYAQRMSPLLGIVMGLLIAKRNF